MNTVLDTAASTKLATALTYIGAGPNAIKELQRRLDEITGDDDRIVVGEITTNDAGMPTCNLEFNCGAYEAPFDGGVNPAAIADLKEVLNKLNYDDCMFWAEIEYLAS